MIIKQLSVFVENKAGRVASIVSSLAAHGVDLSALSLADNADFGIMRMIVSDTAAATEALKDEGVIYKLTDVLAVRLADQPGGLATVLNALTEAGIAVNYMYAFLSKEAGAAMMVLSVEQPAAAMELLLAKGFTRGIAK